MGTERSIKIALAVVWALVVIVLLALALRLVADFVVEPEQFSPFIASTTPPKSENREIKLYFADENASTLIPEKRYINVGNDAPLEAAKIMAELIKGPQSPGRLPTIPPDTRLLSAFSLDSILVLDFSREIQINHPGGSTGELFTVYSIVNTMTENVRGINRVRILVEGVETDTLMGHLDLSEPLLPSTKWMKASSKTMQ